jgi:hypothetical protein
MQDRRSAGVMDRPIDASTTRQSRIRGIHYRIHCNSCYVALMEDDLAPAGAHPLHPSITIVL